MSTQSHSLWTLTTAKVLVALSPCVAVQVILFSPTASSEMFKVRIEKAISMNPVAAWQPAMGRLSICHSSCGRGLAVAVQFSAMSSSLPRKRVEDDGEISRLFMTVYVCVCVSFNC